jgi:hydroxypyruvate isomerase
MSKRTTRKDKRSVDRRQLLCQTIGAAAATSLGARLSCADDDISTRAVIHGHIKQSVVHWCFGMAGERWDVGKTCLVAKGLGCQSVELVGPQDWGILKEHGLVCAIAPNGMPAPMFVKGFNNPQYHDELVARAKQVIDACADARFPNVIAFTGYKWREADNPSSGEITLQEGANNCVRGLKRAVAWAEKKGVTLCLEHLNTRDDTHPMKGHPGYQGDDLDYVASIVRRVDSPRLKLLFDVYHVQVMNGDVMRRIAENQDIIGHVHTAGNPGRGELDDTQEIQYPPIMRKLLDIGYTGFVGQEFIPTRNPLDGLRQAVRLCDVSR